MEHYDVKFGRLNPLKRHTRRADFSASANSEFSDRAHDYGAFRPQLHGELLRAMLNIIYKYSRVYTIKGTALSIISVSLLAVRSLSDITPSFFVGVLQALVGGVLANLYVVGINQLSDIEIDKVNKPYLVLASGELPVKVAVLLTSLYAFLGFCLGWSVKSWPFRLGLFLWYAFGTAYSVHLPLLRWKRIPVLAAMCIWSVQGAIVPILLHLHVQTYITGQTVFLSKHAIFVSGIMSIYAIVIALFKDVPDVEGDKINGINSLASQVGQKRVFWICIWLLEMVYGVAILTGLLSARFWIRLIMVIGHSILGFVLWRNANLVNLVNNEATESFYLFIWKLYYAEYLLVPILRF
ncbi:homogentisate phytyltransferase 1, chloroplastic-like [Rutidosis leptorrhynchoides]|uniref:homogentisate phytyltransferase 1, chloroplastic-like n=1 Tax=Rutidosis leptorrhynchoides TaxID=125765 RepID=UPI003A99F187